MRIGDAQVRGGPDTILIPDVLVVPAAPGPRDVGGLLVYEEPLPLVIEVWTPARDGYDVDAKIPVYRERDDLEIWLLHPRERSLTTWVRQVAGSYVETIYQVGGEMPAALRGVQLHRKTRFDA